MGIKVAAERQAKNNDLIMGQLDSLGVETLQPAIDTVKETKGGVDVMVTNVMGPVTQASVPALQSLFGLSIFVLALAWLGVIINTVCKKKSCFLRIPFHLGWLNGWYFGLVNCLIALLIFVIALMTIGGCDVVHELLDVNKGLALWDSLKLPELLTTCL